MIKSTSIFATSLSALVMACAMAAIFAQPAAAQEERFTRIAASATE